MNNTEMFGEIISPDLLGIKKAKRLIQYIDSLDNSYLKVVEIRQKNDRQFETVIVDLGVERPQKIINDIKRTERLALVFHSDDVHQPEVLALREDFPVVSHLNLQLNEYPKSFCLYEQPYEVIKLTWTPSGFVKQIQSWLNKTAIGTLHEEGQALEPFMFPTKYNLILPSAFADSFEQDDPKLINIVSYQEEDNFSFFLNTDNNTIENEFVAIGLKTPATRHGIIRYTPDNLYKLSEIFQDIPFDLNTALTNFLNKTFREKQSDSILEKKVLFIFSVPLLRDTSSSVERTDHYVFVADKTLKDIGVEYGVFGRILDSSLKGTPIIIGEKPKIGDLSKVNLCQLKIQFSLNSSFARLYNNVPSFSKTVTAIGLGALGSQIINNFVRSGFGRWKLIDEDIFLPHNAARHLLPHCYCIGRTKANACKNILNMTIEEPLIDEAICADILKLHDEKKEKSLDALEKSEFIFDFSASIAVSRFLANSDAFSQAISAYLTPDGTNLIIAAEDHSRNIRLDWLEMLHYRAIINNAVLHNSLNNQNYYRYGNSCRDISAQLSQDDFAIWSGYASKTIRGLVTKQTASLNIFYQEDYNIKSLNIDVSNIKSLRVNNWKIIIDDYLISRISELREKSLPNETGGVLLGNFDSQYEICYIIDVLPPPIDSKKLPVCFIRGCVELKDKVQEIEAKTLGQVGYIGEWHSHPNKYSVIPSEDDMATFRWLADIMNQDSLPTIMIIIGEDKKICLMNSDPSISGGDPQSMMEESL
jgi:integrative and conjugative element protein (TIGR02256 family)